MEMVEFSMESTSIDGLLVVTMKQITDDRGTVRELFRRSAFESSGVALAPFGQINVTETRRGAVRGMHAEDMTKLVAVASGEVFAAYVDLRPDSLSNGSVQTVVLRPGVQVLVPPGVANGFQGVSEVSQYVYCFDREWSPGMPGASITPLDPDLAIPWPLPIDPGDRAQISAKDLQAGPLKSLHTPEAGS